MLSWIAPIIVFGLVVFVHELGHFIAAKLTSYTPATGLVTHSQIATSNIVVNHRRSSPLTPRRAHETTNAMAAANQTVKGEST